MEGACPPAPVHLDSRCVPPLFFLRTLRPNNGCGNGSESDHHICLDRKETDDLLPLCGEPSPPTRPCPPNTRLSEQTFWNRHVNHMKGDRITYNACSVNLSDTSPESCRIRPWDCFPEYYRLSCLQDQGSHENTCSDEIVSVGSFRWVYELCY